MRVAIVQPNYIPWRGYFDLIASVDLFIFHDDIQYTKQDWRNRNKIKTQHGCSWLTVPVEHKKTSQLINQTRIAYDKGPNQKTWQDQHLSKFTNAYANAPYLDHSIKILQHAFSKKAHTIDALNICLIEQICQYLEIRTEMKVSSKLNVSGSKNERLLKLLGSVNASTYLSGPAAKAYIDPALFEENNIKLEYKEYNYAEYPQQHSGFEQQVSVLDLIANMGMAAKAYIRST